MTKEERTEQAKKSRLEKRINKMLKEEARPIFLTFTFNDKALTTTSEKTRLRAVKRYLNEQAKAYILNRDYGSKNEREHYHAIATPKAKIFISQKWQYGFLKYDLIKLESQYLSDKEDVKKWLNKCCEFLTNHALKDTTKGSKIIFSREQPKHKKIKYGLGKEATKILNKNKSAKKERLKIERAQKRAYLLSRNYNELTTNERRRYRRYLKQSLNYQRQQENEA